MQIEKWLKGELEDDEPKPPKDCVLNVAGQRESKAPGIEEYVMRIMVDVLIKTHPKCKHLYPLPGHRELQEAE